MNPDQLLTHYEAIADAPNAVSRLRRFILDLAVRGKLVPQDPNDEPASELLKRISAEKAHLVASSRIRASSGPRRVVMGEAPFALPCGWEWSTLGEVLTKLTDGTHHSPPNGPNGDFKYITAKNIKPSGVLISDVSYVNVKVHEEIYSRCNPEIGDILYVKDGATTGIVTINDLREPFSMLSSVALLKLPDGLFNELAVVFLRSPFFYDQMRGFMKGAAIPRVTLKRMAPAVFPLPPLAEQHRIVARVDELMAICDQLETARAHRETTRDQLTTSTFARLRTPDPESFQTDVRFALDTLPELTTRPDQIKHLRQPILDLAVRGKLVPQDPNDEPASELMKRIVAANVRTGAKPRDAESDPNNQPFSVPGLWEWSYLGAIASKTGSGSTPRGGKASYHVTGIPFLRSQNVYDDGLRLDDVAYIDEKTHLRMSGTRVLAGDLLLNITGGSIGRSCVVPSGLGQANVSQHVAIIRPTFREMAQFFHAVVLSPYFQGFIQNSQTGAGRGGLPKNRMDRIPVALPPLAEQHRIVARVDELMVLCDQLEASLTTSSTTRSHLLEALLAEELSEADYWRPQRDELGAASLGPEALSVFEASGIAHN